MDPVSRQVSTYVDAPPEAVLAVAGDPGRLAEWAAGLAATPLRRHGEDWVADAPFGRVVVRFVAPNDLGVLDHVVTMPDGTAVLNPLRVTAWDDGSEVMFTVRRRPGMTAAQFEADVAAVAADLASLRRIVEGGPPRLVGVTSPDDDRTETRADLLPEEQGLAQDPAALAGEVLAESDARTDDPAAGRSGTGPTGVTGDDPLVSDTD